MELVQLGAKRQWRSGGDFPRYKASHDEEARYDVSQEEKYGHHADHDYVEICEGCRQHHRKRTRRIFKPLVDLSEYEKFCLHPTCLPSRYPLPCDLADVGSQGFVAIENVLHLSAADHPHIFDGDSERHDKDGHEYGGARTLSNRDEAGLQDNHGHLSYAQKLMDCKLKIMATRLKYGEDVWFLAAQLVNPYEILPYFAVRVLNRAFFKMWELMQMFPGLVPLVATKPKLLSAHICEGPGGFVEAVCMRRSQHVEKARGFGMQDFTPDMDSTSNKEASDCWFAITLAVPGSQKDCMKMQMSRLKENRSKSVEGYVHYGADKSGDITNPNNISSFVEFVLEKTCGEKMHLITGDGAFDVSEDFSSQEQSHAHLFFSEILIAARLQSAGGALVLKIFDCFTEATWTMLFILASLYTTVEIVRLRTSRVCNSERFVVAQGFRLLSKGLEEKLMSISRAWHQCTKDGLQAALKMYMPCPLPFLEALGEGNAAIASDQSTSILHAVSVAEDMGEKLSFAHASQQKSILSILRRKMKTMELRRVNALTICKALNIPLASSVL